MAALAFALMLPWLGILCFVYWLLPRRLPRTPGRRRYDLAVIVLALLAAAAITPLAWYGWQPPITDEFGHRTGDIWPAVLAALYSYAAFTVVLLVGLIIRQRIWGRRQP